MTRDLRTLINLLYMYCTEPRTPRRMFENIGPGYAIGEQQSKRTQSGEQRSSSSGRNRGAAVEADAIGWRAAAEAGAIGEQQLDARRRQTGSASSSGSGCRNRPRAREQQLKRTQSGRSSSSESCPALDYAR